MPPGLHVSFQRYVRPLSDIVPEVLASSLGALPVGLGLASDFIVPVADNEAFWIGLELEHGAMPTLLRLSIEMPGLELCMCAALAVVTSNARIAGFPGSDGRMHAFARVRPTSATEAQLVFCAYLELGNGCIAETKIRLVDYGRFVAETGKPPPSPLDANAGYRGWLLP